MERLRCLPLWRPALLAVHVESQALFLMALFLGLTEPAVGPLHGVAGRAGQVSSRNSRAFSRFGLFNMKTRRLFLLICVAVLVLASFHVFPRGQKYTIN